MRVCQQLKFCGKFSSCWAEVSLLWTRVPTTLLSSLLCLRLSLWANLWRRSPQRDSSNLWLRPTKLSVGQPNRPLTPFFRPRFFVGQFPSPVLTKRPPTSLSGPPHLQCEAQSWVARLRQPDHLRPRDRGPPDYPQTLPDPLPRQPVRPLPLQNYRCFVRPRRLIGLSKGCSSEL